MIVDGREYKTCEVCFTERIKREMDLQRLFEEIYYDIPETSRVFTVVSAPFVYLSEVSLN